MGLFIILLLVIAAVIVLIGVALVKARNKVTKNVMRATGLGNAMNAQMDQVNAKALKKLDEMLAEGKITQEQYEKRKKNLSIDHDFNAE